MKMKEKTVDDLVRSITAIVVLALCVFVYDYNRRLNIQSAQIKDLQQQVNDLYNNQVFVPDDVCVFQIRFKGDDDYPHLKCIYGNGTVFKLYDLVALTDDIHKQLIGKPAVIIGINDSDYYKVRIKLLMTGEETICHATVLRHLVAAK